MHQFTFRVHVYGTMKQRLNFCLYLDLTLKISHYIKISKSAGKKKVSERFLVPRSPLKEHHCAALHSEIKNPSVQ